MVVFPQPWNILGNKSFVPARDLGGPHAVHHDSCDYQDFLQLNPKSSSMS